jgi:hypothetical protein
MARLPGHHVHDRDESNGTTTTYTANNDIFTIGAGQVDAWAAYNNTPFPAGSAASPRRCFTRTAPSNYFSTPFSASTAIWGTGSSFATTAIWGTNVSGTTAIWGSTAIWGTTTIWGSTDLGYVHAGGSTASGAARYAGAPRLRKQKQMAVAVTMGKD